MEIFKYKIFTIWLNCATVTTWHLWSRNSSNQWHSILCV